MKTAIAASAVLAAGLWATALPTHAQGGRIGFAGSIVERTCVMRAGKPDCPADRPTSVTVRHLPAATALAATGSTLLDYALRRQPTQRWALVEVSYR
jgi:type 1 fimbria pilin